MKIKKVMNTPGMPNPGRKDLGYKIDEIIDILESSEKRLLAAEEKLEALKDLSHGHKYEEED